MAIISGIIGGASAAKAAGINFKGITGLFGGGNEPNAGNESFVDALDNYEGISTSRASMLQHEIIEAIKAGANDRRIGKMVTSAGGYTDVNGVMTSWKWKIIQRFVDDIRDQVQRQSINSGSGTRPGGVIPGPSGSGGGIPQSLIWGAVALFGFFALKGLK